VAAQQEQMAGMMRKRLEAMAAAQGMTIEQYQAQPHMRFPVSA